MACSKSAASAGGDKKAKVPKELLTPEEKYVQAAKLWKQHANFKLKQTQHAAEHAARVATKLAYQM
jgi:hypothetical protein